MDHIEIAENTLLGDLMKTVVEQLKVMPKPWQSMPESEQQYFLNRIELQVADAVRLTVAIVTSRGMINVPAKVESVTFKDGCKVVLKALGPIENTIHLAEAEGTVVSVIIPEGELLNDEGKPSAEPDQRGLELGQEYSDSDGIGPEYGDEDFSGDKLYDEAVALVRRESRASISMVQRSLRIGYNRAARLIEAMERNAVVSCVGTDGSRSVYPLEEAVEA